MKTSREIKPGVETTQPQPGSLTKKYKGRITCTQPGCLFKRRGFGAQQLADITVRLLAGEPVSRFVSSAEMILARPQCISCALRIMVGRKAFHSVEEWQRLDDLGKWHNRRERRRRNRLE